jgi:arylformamidase
MKKIFDITLPLYSGMPVWPGEPELVIKQFQSLADGDIANVTRVEMMVHTGTHLDAPCHFVDGRSSVDELPLEVLVGPVRVIELPDECDLITETVLKSIDFEGMDRIIFKTRNSQYWENKNASFQTDYVALDPGAARILVERGVRLVGIDYLSISTFSNTTLPHQILLGADMVILEGVDLSKVLPGDYQLFCLPIKFKGADGAPARVILIEE